MTIECEHPQQVNHYVGKVAGSLARLIDVDNPQHHIAITYKNRGWSVFNVGTEILVKEFNWIDAEFTVIEEEPPIVEEPDPIEEEPVEEEPQATVSEDMRDETG